MMRRREGQPGAARSAAETEAAVRGYLDRLRRLGIYLTFSAAERELVATVVESAGDLTDDAGLRWRVLCELGSETDWSSSEPRCCSDAVWHFDTECIEDEDAYPDIVRRLARMSQGALDVQDVRLEAGADGTGTIWLTSGGAVHSFTVCVDDDWFDTDVLGWLNDLLVRSGSPKTFHDLPTGGQDLLLLFADQSTYDTLLGELPDLFAGPGVPRDGQASAAVRLGIAAVWAAVGALVAATITVKGYVYGLLSLPGALFGAIAITGIVLARNRDAGSSRRFSRLVWGSVLVGLMVVAIVVVGYGGRLPYLDQIPKDKTVAYLERHLPVAVTYTGEGVLSKDGRRQYLFTDADGLDFRCTATYRTGTGVMLYADPTLWCSWPIAYAHQYDDQLVEAFSPWVYDPDFGTVVLRDEDDAAALAQVLAAALDTIRAPVPDDPDQVFVPFSFDVQWAPPGRAPTLLQSFYQPVGNTPAPTAREIHDQLVSAVAQADQDG